MAIGADSSIRAPQSPLAPKKQAGAAFRPFAIDDNRVDDMTSNQWAAGVGAGRSAVSEMDRAGVSRGRGQNYYGQVADASAMQAADAEARSTQQAAANANRSARQAFDNTRRDEMQGYQGLLERLRSSQASLANAKRGWGQDQYEAWSRGRFGLDQQQLDYTPLLGRLFDQLGG